MTCVSHSLNLTLCDTAHSCVKVVSFFGIIQCIYSLYSKVKRYYLTFSHFSKLIYSYVM